MENGNHETEKRKPRTEIRNQKTVHQKTENME